MHSHYILYPKTLEKLEKGGIVERVNRLKKSEGLPFFGGYLDPNAISREIEQLKDAGYYEKIPPDFTGVYTRTLNGILRSPKNYSWLIKRAKGYEKEPCQLEDLMLFSGEIASTVLKPDEIWDSGSSSEFVAIVSLFLMQQSRDPPEGYTWTTKRDDGSEVMTKITGSDNADLRIFQQDITPYPTIDPFGNEIGMRPITEEDSGTVAAHHSTEAKLLITAMRYIEQQHIPIDILKNKAKPLLEWAGSLSQKGGWCTEQFGGDKMSRNLFVEYQMPLNSKFAATLPYMHGAYNAYIKGEDLVIYDGEKIVARFLPEVAEHLVKGVFVQASRGLGRTSVATLIEAVKYRYSAQFTEDQKPMVALIAQLKD